MVTFGPLNGECASESPQVKVKRAFPHCGDRNLHPLHGLSAQCDRERT